jgi:hypothetical protein
LHVSHRVSVLRVLCPTADPPVPTEQDAVWILQAVWRFGEGIWDFLPAGFLSLLIQHVAYCRVTSDYKLHYPGL